jgi:hypothetical protein
MVSSSSSTRRLKSIHWLAVFEIEREADFRILIPHIKHANRFVTDLIACAFRRHKAVRYEPSPFADHMYPPFLGDFEGKRPSF